MPTSTWGVTFENKDKDVLAYGSTVASGSLTRSLNAPAELSLDLAITGQDTKALFAQLEVGAVYARLAEGSTTRFFGVLNDAQVSLSDSATVSVTFMDLAQQYATSYYYRKSTGTKYFLWGYNGGGTQTSTVSALVTDYSFVAGSEVLLPLTLSGTASGSRSIEPGQETSRLEMLDGIAAVQGGIDWYVEPDQTLKLASSLGTDKSSTVSFQYGATTSANVTSANVQYLPPRNRILQSEENGFVKVATKNDASVTAFGCYEVIVPRLERGVSSETDVADQVLRTGWRRTVDLELEATVAPRPWVDFDLGDTVGVRVVTDAFTINTSQRVNQIDLAFDEQFVEAGLSVSMEIK
jgi:hypothetical protein